MAAKISGVLISRDTNGNLLQNNIGYVNPALANTSDADRWTKIDQSARALNSLTSNAYVDFQLLITYSTNEEAAD